MRLKNIFLSICALLPMAAIAQDANKVLDQVVSTYNKSNGISADYSMTYDNNTDRGSIVMTGSKFRILSNDLKCWYDGKTQWAYSTMTEEVNVTEPTQEELQLSNPYAALLSFKKSSHVTIATTPQKEYLLTMIPQSGDSDVKLIQLFIGSKSYQIEKATFVMVDNSSYTVVVENYKTGLKFTDSTFKYDSQQVPEGTQVVDLR